VSFRTRLGIFFVLIVAVPMIAITVLVVSVTNDARTGKADARVGGALVTARGFYADDLASSRQAARAIAADPRLGEAIRSGSQSSVQSVARSLAAEQGAAGLVITGQDGQPLATVGSDLIAQGSVKLQNQRGLKVGAVEASTTTTDEYLKQVHQGTGLDAALSGTDNPVAATVDLGEQQLPDPGKAADVTVGSNDERAATRVLPGGTGLRLTMFGPIGPKGFFSKQPLVLAALALFFVVAMLFILATLRALSAQIRTMLSAARRIGDGDFSGEVPVVGRDEMAGLATEFNRMRERLAAQVGQLRKQRDEIEVSTHRIGEAFAAGLDRQAQLEIVLETTLSACKAEYGMIALGGSSGGEVERGMPTPELRDGILAGEERSTREGHMVDMGQDGVSVLSSPLAVKGESTRHGGVMSVARAGEPFNAAERDVFNYLLDQISVSIENVSLHELVSQQAVTDDLTGLSNTRRFKDILEKEAARAQRFGHELSLLMLDLDDFKQINDSFGHLQGDEVLRRVARSLDVESRGFDEPCRWGGEEFAIALPETDEAGALDVAERVRRRIEAQVVERVGGTGTLSVTASVGVATARGGLEEVDALIAAADAALYRAKAGGKNRVEAAEPAATG
jgi:diguanylate cyclase (GGDEF)-like protein